VQSAEAAWQALPESAQAMVTRATACDARLYRAYEALWDAPQAQVGASELSIGTVHLESLS
jgi:hypothetical protein